MHKRDLQLEAIKALREWSTWLVTVQTAVIAAISSEFIHIDSQREIYFDLTIGSFAGSVLFGAWLVGAVPSIIQNLTDEIPMSKVQVLVLQMDASGIYTYKQFKISIWVFAFFEHILFIIGVICFVCSIWK